MKRLYDVQAVQYELSTRANQNAVGKVYEVLIEGLSKRSKEEVYGRNSQNLTVIFPKENYKPGDYAMVKITEFTSATVRGEVVK
jgi:tRNA-2-methylthio-N6-dimethylallyladenosine synthase